jgi:hypothetical protein
MRETPASERSRIAGPGELEGRFYQVSTQLFISTFFPTTKCEDNHNQTILEQIAKSLRLPVSSSENEKGKKKEQIKSSIK